MVAAIYARKSTEQTGVSDDQKSVARQVEHARAYALRKGWTVADEHVYIDDGISGAEFANRPGFLRLMNALKPRPPFQILVMSEESRPGREAIETAYALKQLVSKLLDFGLAKVHMTAPAGSRCSRSGTCQQAERRVRRARSAERGEPELRIPPFGQRGSNEQCCRSVSVA
jgi:DNA invertase Pin-like site-specific DNA recombinase